MVLLSLTGCTDFEIIVRSTPFYPRNGSRDSDLAVSDSLDCLNCKDGCRKASGKNICEVSRETGAGCRFYKRPNSDGNREANRRKRC